MDEGFIELEYIIEFPPFEDLTRDRHTGSGDDRHISVEGELRQCFAIESEKNLYDIRADTIRLSIANIRIIHNTLIRGILRVFDDEILRRHGGGIRYKV